MSHLLAERRISLTKLGRRENVSPQTVWRWWKKGAHGHRLETFVVGSKRFTTEEAYARWVEAVTIAANGDLVGAASRTNRQRQAAISRAERELAAEGI